MKLTEEQQKSFSLEVFDAIDRVFKVQDLKVILGQEKDINGFITTVEVEFTMLEGKEKLVGYNFYNKDFSKWRSNFIDVIVNRVMDSLLYDRFNK